MNNAKIENDERISFKMTKLTFVVGSCINDACAIAAKLALERGEQVAFDFNGETYHAYPEKLIDAVKRTRT